MPDYPEIYTKKIGGLFVDVKEASSGVKYVQLTTSRKNDAGEWIKTRIAVFNDQVDALCEALLHAKEYL